MIPPIEEFTSLGLPNGWGKSDPLKVTDNGDGSISIGLEGTLPGDGYNIDGEFECRLSKLDVIKFRDWLNKALSS